MNILVCMKQVPDDSVEIHLNADGAKKATEQLNCFLSNIQWEDQKQKQH